jgi:hypothetical protein
MLHRICLGNHISGVGARDKIDDLTGLDGLNNHSVESMISNHNGDYDLLELNVHTASSAHRLLPTGVNTVGTVPRAIESRDLASPLFTCSINLIWIVRYLYYLTLEFCCGNPSSSQSGS